MIVASVVVMVLVVLFILLIISIITSRREFCAIRLLSLSTAAECDAVGGVGVSILSLYPQSISAVVNLLDSRYPLSEVVVVLGEGKQHNLLQHLKIRYALVPCMAERCAVYRSRERAYRRLVVVVTQEVQSEAELYDLAASSALYDYLMRVPSAYRLFPSAVGRVAERIAAEVASEVDVVTTAEAGIEILSRRAWLNRGGFGGRITQGEKLKILHIFEPLAFARESDRDYSLLIERSEYNFWDYFALKIMKTGNKLLSLIKPKNIL